VDDVEDEACRVAAVVLAADALAGRCEDADRLRLLQWAAEAGRTRLARLAGEEPEPPAS
jgi:hypothetical protein